MKHLSGILPFCLLLAICCSSCRDGEPLMPQEQEQVCPPDPSGEVIGFYLLNQGNMGSNKASLDYFDFETGVYSRNIFAARNPEITKELGDVGNDLKAYGEKLYAVINCSNLIEVMDLRSARHIKAIEVPNCRYLAFANGKAYASSYAGPVQVGNRILGFVAEIDTVSLEITRRCTVGYNPEEMAVIGRRLYVVNSGGYLKPDYDNTLSVIDLDTFTELKKITLLPNMHRMRVTPDGKLLISSRGNYANTASDIILFDPQTETVSYDFGFNASNLDLVGDSCWLYAWDFNSTTGQERISYHCFDLRKPAEANADFLDKTVTDRIQVPYCIAVHPVTREIILCDAADYVSPGTLYYFKTDGSLKWQTATGDIPSAIVFVHPKP